MIQIRWRERLESAANARGHTLARAAVIARVRSETRLRCVHAGIDCWTTPDASVTARKSPPRKTPYKRAPRPTKRRSVRLLVPIEVLLVRVAPGELDDDNLRAALKPVRDGVADAFGSDDRTPMIVWSYAQEKGRGRRKLNGAWVLGDYYVVITIRERS